MADVFVSYARADKVRVAPLVAAMEAQGWSVGSGNRTRPSA
jgi:adenylate cyclase